MLIASCVWLVVVILNSMPMMMMSIALMTQCSKRFFDFKIDTSPRMIERFKNRIVANSQPQILGFDCVDVHAPTVPTCEIKLLLAIAAFRRFRDIELYQMDTTTAFISAALKPGELIYCNPPRGVDLGLGSNCLPR